MWTFLFFFSLISLMGIGFFKRGEIVQWARERMGRWASRSGEQTEEDGEQDELVPSSASMRVSKEVLERKMEELKVEDAAGKLKESSSTVAAKDNPSFEAVHTVAEFRAKQDAVPQGFNPEEDVLLTNELRKDFETIFRGTDVEAFLGVGLSINGNGQLVVPMEAGGLLTKKYDPIVTHGGKLMVRNLVVPEKMIELAFRMGTPLFYESSEGGIERLSAEQVEALVVDKEQANLLERIEKQSKDKAAWVKERGELIDTLSERNREAEALAEELEKGRREIEALQSRNKELERERDVLNGKVEALQVAVSAAAAQGVAPAAPAFDGPEIQQQAERVSEPEVEAEAKTDREAKSMPNAEKKQPPEPSGSEKAKPDGTKHEAETSRRARREEGADADGKRQNRIATPSEMERWLKQAASDDGKQNYLHFGILAATKRRSGAARGLFDKQRLFAFLADKANEEGVALPDISVSTGYILGDADRAFEVEYAVLQLKSPPASAYLRPFELSHFIEGAKAGNVLTDEKTKKRYNTLTQSAKAGKIPPLTEEFLSQIEKRNEWK